MKIFASWCVYIDRGENMNEEKFAKSIDDKQLDEVAGGTRAEIQKDIKFLNAIGIKVDENASIDDLENAWKQVCIGGFASSHIKNIYAKAAEIGPDHPWYGEKEINKVLKQTTRQDAMIDAMRKTKKFVDLDQYL